MTQHPQTQSKNHAFNKENCRGCCQIGIHSRQIGLKKENSSISVVRERLYNVKFNTKAQIWLLNYYWLFLLEYFFSPRGALVQKAVKISLDLCKQKIDKIYFLVLWYNFHKNQLILAIWNFQNCKNHLLQSKSSQGDLQKGKKVWIFPWMFSKDVVLAVLY